MAPFVLRHLPNSTFAFILSKSVFPINVPSPNPDLELIILFLERIYGSPNTSRISFENHGPSSHILTSVTLLLLSKLISTRDLPYLTAFPIKFLNP